MIKNELIIASKISVLENKILKNRNTKIKKYRAKFL